MASKIDDASSRELVITEQTSKTPFRPKTIVANSVLEARLLVTRKYRLPLWTIASHEILPLMHER